MSFDAMIGIIKLLAIIVVIVLFYSGYRLIKALIMKAGGAVAKNQNKNKINGD